MIDAEQIPQAKPFSKRYSAILNMTITDRDSQTNEDDQTLYSVNGYSWFRKLIDFHPTESLPPDLMHSTADRICPLIISALLKKAVQQRLLTYANIEQQEKIDSSRLVLLQHNDIVQIFPRIKDHVKFIDQHVLNENNTSTSLLLNENIEFNSDNKQITDSDVSNHNCFDDNDDIFMKLWLPSDYEEPNLTLRMQQCIDDNNLSRFFPHTAMCSELLSLVFDGITESYKLFYLTNDEYKTMAKCILKKLHVPSPLVYQAIYESIKEEFECKRKQLQMTNHFVKLKQDKYGNGNVELLKDDPNNVLFYDLWLQSFNIRRLCIRELTIIEVLERFPGYCRLEMGIPKVLAVTL
ncbi:unnamed protein product [Rotaria sordida]|uniref:Uncharacterized protein n=2 Tax=Rotaria sordida TaxID=392033 RepID=A0A819SM64_9BILA|nr:unnamed protein product [Rotaria sordida]